MSAGATDALCGEDRRKAAVLEHPTLNGVDFVEYAEDPSAPPGKRHRLAAVFLKNAPGSLAAKDFQVEGGARVTGIRVLSDPVAPVPPEPKRLWLFVDQPGDFSIYTLRVAAPPAVLDPRLAAAAFSFKAGCPSELDCRQAAECPPEPAPEPALDYLAKDYSSFRRLLLDLIPQLAPGWLERNPADLGMALVELLAYQGDQLSYFQDAIATESYLDTCRHRISARRHARLVDYRTHDGRNAWTFVQLDVAAAAKVPQGTMLLTRISRPLRGQAAPPESVIPPGNLDLDTDPAVRDAIVFETTAPIAVDPGRNELRIHTWEDRHCCLPRGATGASLFGADLTTKKASAPPLAEGDYLLLEEVKGTATGLPQDADPAHRQVVRLIAKHTTADPVFRADLSAAGELQAVTAAGQAVLPLLRVTWRVEDALTFPLCLTGSFPETGDLISRVSLARGNVIPCDHGRSLVEELPPPAPSGSRSARLENRLSSGPLTFQAMPPEPLYDDQARLISPRYELDAAPREAQPAVSLLVHHPVGDPEPWLPVPDLLESHPLDHQFVAEVDNDGRAILRYGDDDYGRRPSTATKVEAIYRIGNGRAGNLGSGSLAHLVLPPTWLSTVTTVRHPLPALGGADPETLEEVRQLAPRAFQAEQLRAVTEADYETAALALPQVAAARCTFRWTGSWITVFVAVHPRDPADLVTLPGGRTQLADALAAKVRAQLLRYKLAGYDLEVRTAQYVSLELEVQLCIARGYFRGDVLESVGRALSSRRNPDGTLGFFYPPRLGFGQAVYLSRLYAAVERVAGVESALVTVFKRYWTVAGGELATGVLPLAGSEIARLDNDPNFAENGVLRLTALGGL
ncbi:MAG TPA: putative baseplate assembly protein [Thermoanaerobaculia bacterium]|nr:putative baseplate assembly protein [Thermoanaerobaculia bacterium]